MMPPPAAVAPPARVGGGKLEFAIGVLNGVLGDYLHRQSNGLATPMAVQSLHALHELTVSGSYGMVRQVNRLAGTIVDVVLDVLEQSREMPEAPNGKR